ncbi:hypothetical protein AKUA2003_PHAGE200260 (plasmid) [Apilactobacillus kunkeei]|nr:hypothetical protein AKUA1001_PHAGE200260 [Apilactobacillus kunkeei]CAI2672083.1 hypothetical protein AKUA2003_PHAGE200260 [Apilactobacillus kunkeei]CAI2803574.1 hypothetical protein AKUA2002_PHAGE200260 [Apilactobacillus kunkeei]
MWHITNILSNIAICFLSLFIIGLLISYLIFTFVRWIKLANSKKFDFFNEKSKISKIGYKQSAVILFKKYLEKNK